LGVSKKSVKTGPLFLKFRDQKQNMHEHKKKEKKLQNKELMVPDRFFFPTLRKFPLF